MKKYSKAFLLGLAGGFGALSCVTQFELDCTSGPCCTEQGTYRSPGYLCEKKTVELRCSHPLCGANAEKKLKTQYCSGTSSDCDGEISHEWALLEPCLENQYCWTSGQEAGCQNAPDTDKDGVDSCTDCNDQDLLIQEAGQFSLEQVSLDGAGDHAVVNPNDEIQVSLRYHVSQPESCSSCKPQLLFGTFGTGYGHEPQHCHQLAELASCPDTGVDEVSFTLRAPGTPGEYEMRRGLSQEENCDQALENYDIWIASWSDPVATITVDLPPCSSWLHYLTEVSLDQGGPEITVNAAEVISFSANYFAAQSGTSPGNIDQIVVGIEGDAQICKDLGIIPGCPVGTSGSMEGYLTAPSTPGTYRIKYKMFAHYNCQGANEYYETNPPPLNRTVGIIQVTSAGSVVK